MPQVHIHYLNDFIFKIFFFKLYYLHHSQQPLRTTYTFLFDISIKVNIYNYLVFPNTTIH